MSLCYALLLVVSAAAPEPSQDLKKELEAFQGTWVLVAGTSDGKPMAETEVKRFKRRFNGQRFEFLQDDRIVLEGTFEIDPTQTPKTIDLKFVDQQKKEGKLLGIYELEGDDAKHCLSGEARPAKLASEAGSGQILLHWRREK